MKRKLWSDTRWSMSLYAQLYAVDLEHVGAKPPEFVGNKGSSFAIGAV